MKTKNTSCFSSVTIQSLAAAAALCFAFPVGPLHAAPVGSTFTYQGSLADNGQPANGSYELTLTLYDAAVGGSSLGTLIVPGVTVTQGVFTTQLDYGAAAFDGNARWLEIAVRLESDGQPAVTLTPRQAINANYPVNC